MDVEQLTLRKMTFGGIPYDDDWLVMWQGLNIGRILKQSGVTMGVPACSLSFQLSTLINQWQQQMQSARTGSFLG